MFAGFCKDPKDGGLKGIQFAVDHSTANRDWQQAFHCRLPFWLSEIRVFIAWVNIDVSPASLHESRGTLDRELMQ
jgi:hypothetical protein